MSLSIQPFNIGSRKTCSCPATPWEGHFSLMPWGRRGLNFPRNTKDCTPEQRDKVVWSEESTLQWSPYHSGRVTTSTVSWHDIAHLVLKINHPESLIIWGCFIGTAGLVDLYFLPKIQMINSDQYITVQDDHLLPFYNSINHNNSVYARLQCATRQGKWQNSLLMTTLRLWSG